MATRAVVPKNDALVVSIWQVPFAVSAYPYYTYSILCITSAHFAVVIILSLARFARARCKLNLQGCAANLQGWGNGLY